MLIPHFKDGKGVVMLKTHHNMSDGLGFSTFFMCLSGEFDPKQLPGVKPLGFIKNVIITILTPFLAARATLELLLAFRTPTSLNSDQRITGIKRGAYTEDLVLDDIKNFTKSKGATVNDYLCALLSNTLYEYCDNHKEEKFGGIPKTINMGMPYSLREPPKSIKDVRLVNDFITVPIELQIRKELDESLPIMRDLFAAYRTSLKPFGFLSAFKILVNLPYTLPKFGLDFLTEKYTILFTNLNASKILYNFDGKKQLGQFYYCPGIGQLNLGISFCNVGG